MVSIDLSINFYILIKLLIKIKKINQLNYFIEYILISDPKVVFTVVDNNPNFYKLKKFFPKKFFITLQNGLRTDTNFEKKNDNLTCDVIFCNGKSDINFYRSRVKSKIIPIGTIKNNNIKNEIKPFKNCISYISLYRDIYEDQKNIDMLGKFNNITWGEYIESEKLLIKSLYDYCRKNKIKFYIVGCNIRKFIKEKQWYQDLIGNKKINFIKKTNPTSSYNFLKRTKYIVSMDSTLGCEFLSRGYKIIFFSRIVKNSKMLSKILNFGAPFNKKNKDFFFSNEINEKEISRLLNNLKRYSKKKWFKKIKKIKDQLMIYDFNNNILRKEISKINNYD